MNEPEKKRRPVLRLTFRDRESGESFEIGVVWPASVDKAGIVGSFAPQLAAAEKKMPIIEAMKLAHQKRGYLNVSITEEGARYANRWARGLPSAMRSKPKPPSWPDEADSAFTGEEDFAGDEELF